MTRSSVISLTERQTQSSENSRRILIVGTIICTLNYAVVWMGPAYVSDSMKVMVAYISYMLLGVTFPVMDISLNSMLPVMTNDMEERNFLAMLKNFAYGLGGGLNLIAPIVFAKFNSSVKGYNIMNLLAMGIIFVLARRNHGHSSASRTAQGCRI